MTKREVRSFLMPRDPSIDRRFRPCPAKRERLFGEVEEESCDGSDGVEDEDFYDTLSTGSGLTETCDFAVESGALVYLRLKPVEQPSSAYSITEEGKVLITGPPTDSASSSKNKNSMEKHFSFTEIFDSEVCQRDVYEKCIGDKIEAEDNFTVLTYGTSGSGKTFTLLGDDQRPGIIPRSLEHIFALYSNNLYPHPAMKLVNGRVAALDDTLAAKETMLNRQLLDQCKNLETNHVLLQQSIRNDHQFGRRTEDDVSIIIWITFVEIYNELVYDLLALTKNIGSNVAQNATRRNLKIVCNDGQVFIKGVTSIYVKSTLEALKLLRYGLQKLTYASTSINANSSRSHCVFFVDILKYFRSGSTSQTSYKFCDLAGSERLVKTGNTGSRLKEAQRINTSLMVLGRCLDAANNMASSSSTANKKERIPFRESKLTMLLQAALQGNEKLAMIVNVNPTEKYYEENLHVLNFASIANNIIFKAPIVKQNQSRYSVFGTTPDNNYIQQLLQQNASLQADVESRNEVIEEQIQHINELIHEVYHWKEEIERLTNEHANDLLKQEQELRVQLVDSFRKDLEINKRKWELRMQSEMDNQKRSYELKIEFLKRRHQEEIEDLQDLENTDEKNNTQENDENEDNNDEQISANLALNNQVDVILIKDAEKENMQQEELDDLREALENTDEKNNALENDEDNNEDNNDEQIFENLAMNILFKDDEKGNIQHKSL